jgi:transcriptional regulator with XRE-family HTH domain
MVLRSVARVSQTELARRAGTSQPTIAAYESWAKSPTLRTLERLAESVGLEVHPTFVPPMTREERRSLALHLAIAERFVEDAALVRRIARQNLRTMRAANPAATETLRAWQRALDGPDEELVDLLRDPRPRARALRQVTPFAGVLDPAERWEVYRRFARCHGRERREPRQRERAGLIS